MLVKVIIRVHINSFVSQINIKVQLVHLLMKIYSYPLKTLIVAHWPFTEFLEVSFILLWKWNFSLFDIQITFWKFFVLGILLPIHLYWWVDNSVKDMLTFCWLYFWLIYSIILLFHVKREGRGLSGGLVIVVVNNAWRGFNIYRVIVRSW